MTGTPFLALVALVTVGAFICTVMTWPRLSGPGVTRIAGRTGLLLVVNVLVLLTAATQVNAQYLFFAGWTDLRGAITGTITYTALSRGDTAAQAASRHVAGRSAQLGATLRPLSVRGMTSDRVLTFMVHGPRSGLTGTVSVQLPPGYLSTGNTRRYPVLEAFQGYPGTTQQWISRMNLGGVMASQVAAHHLRDALIVEPQTEFPLGTDNECVNGSAGEPQVETYLTQDVPNWITHTFRVERGRSSWAVIGLSAGAYCAAASAMLHPSQYAASIVMGGYFHPDFGPAYQPFPPDGRLANRYDLVRLARRQPPSLAMWIETSHADALSYASSAMLLKRARPPLAVHAIVLQHAGHRMGLWQQLLPSALRWLGADVPGFTPR